MNQPLRTAPPRRVLITGASTGIGLSCALDLAASGLRVYAGVRRERDGIKLMEAAASRGLSAHLSWVCIDVTSEPSIAEAKAAIAKDDGRLFALINNAGIVVAAPLEVMTSNELRLQMEVNFVGAAAVTRAFIPMLRAHAQGRRGASRVVMMSSIAGRSSLPFAWPYSASKHAMEALADGLRVELGPQGIDTVLIEPGAIKTPIWDKSVLSGEAKIDSWSDEAKTLYGSRLRAFADVAKRAGSRGISTEHVCRAVRLALFCRVPRVRYVVGNDAVSRVWLGRLLPARWIDWAVSRAVSGKPGTSK